MSGWKKPLEFMAKICPWLLSGSGFPTVGILPHTFLILGMLTDYVIEHFLLKIAFETAKMLPVLAKKYKKKKNKPPIQPWALGILLGKCHRGRGAELGREEAWEGRREHSLIFLKTLRSKL